MIFNNVINRHIHPSIVDENLYVGHYHVCRCNIFAINTISNDHCIKQQTAWLHFDATYM